MLNAYGRSQGAIPHQSNPASLRRSLAHWCNPAPPIHGQRSPKRVKWDWRNKPRSPHSYPARFAKQATLHSQVASLLLQVSDYDGRPWPAESRPVESRLCDRSSPSTHPWRLFLPWFPRFSFLSRTPFKISLECVRLPHRSDLEFPLQHAILDPRVRHRQ